MIITTEHLAQALKLLGIAAYQDGAEHRDTMSPEVEKATDLVIRIVATLLEQAKASV